MGVARPLEPERAEHQQLLRGVGEVVVSADHVGDPHLGVVHSDGEVVEQGPVPAGDHEVVGEPVLEPHRAANQVVDHGLAVVGDAEPDRRALARPRLAAVPGVTVGALEGADLLGRRGVGVGLAGIEQLGDPRAVALGALGLAQRPLVPVELEPAQRVEDLGDVLGVERSRSVSSIRSTSVP